MTNNSFYIADTTLRDGEQAPGVVFPLDAKLRIAEMLDSIGVEELELGSPFISELDCSNIRTVVQAGFRFRTTCWSRARHSDIEAAARTGADGVNISFPVSDIQLKALGKSRDWVLQEMKTMLRFAQERFQFVALGAQDASRADLDFLLHYCALAHDLGAFRVRIADTIGRLNPFSTFQLIQCIGASLPTGRMEIEFHGHNDLGMATANSLAAIQAGANSISTTVNGLGERAGNAAFEEVIMAYKHSLNGELPYNLQNLQALSAFVAEKSGRPLWDAKPITGRLTHSHESGIHTNSLLKDKRTYELFDASEVGKSGSVFIYGTHSGSAAVIDLFKKHHIELNLITANKVLVRIKEKSWAEKRNIGEEEVFEIFEQIDNTRADCL